MSSSSKSSLENRSIIVTGATGGIGSAIVSACIESGAKVFAAGRNNDVLQQMQRQFGEEIYPLNYDITDTQAVKNAFLVMQRQISEGNMPPLYGLVNGAGIMLESALAMTSADKLQQQLNVNYLAPYQHMQLASRLMMRSRQGSIVNIVSQVSEQGSAGMSAYAASKAALTGATKSLAKELASIGIRVNAVAPGFIETKLTAHYTDEKKHEVVNRVALKRIGSTAEVANAVLYLLSEQSSYTSGHVLPVDGIFCP